MPFGFGGLEGARVLLEGEGGPPRFAHAESAVSNATEKRPASEEEWIVIADESDAPMRTCARVEVKAA